MSETKDGGPAFPQWDGHAFTGDPQQLQGGMSLRDWFAGMALQGLLAMCVERGLKDGDEILATEYAYRYAAAMLAEREKRK